MSAQDENDLAEIGRLAREALGDTNLVLIGLMGAGKSVIGRMLAQLMELPFVDTDDEIVAAAQMPITEIFEAYGEPEFRALETRVVKRVLQTGPQIVSTGGGAFMNEETRQNVLSSSVTLWLKADFDVLWQRVSKRSTRPLLQQPNPQKILRDLMDARYPIYAQADLVVQSRNAPKTTVVNDAAKVISGAAEIAQSKLSEMEN
ncbi:shikimate kinase [Lentilitoribacter sp. EG35]|uniref:shikimate kinase n=1 Tax=Lentilitoribacter sp. EG35 TaxID=3234192 RepID=UPI00346059F8